MKYILVLGLGALLAQGVGAVELPFYEPFPNTYTEGERLGGSTSGVIWSTGNSTGTTSPTNTAVARLTYPGLLTTSDSRGVLLWGTPSSNRDRGVAFTTAVTIDGDNPALYASFLLNVQTMPSTSRRIAYFRNSTSSGNASAGIFLNAAGQLQVVKSSDTPAAAVTSALGTGTHLIVMRYRWVSAVAGDDEVALWLNPGSLGVPESAVPAPDIATTSGNDVSTLNAFFISHRTEASGTLWLDEVRVATDWAGVTPTDGAVVETRPYVTTAFLSEDGFVLRGTNGPANAAYSVLATADLTLAHEQWPAVQTNHFDVNGNFDVTNATLPGVAAQFYRVKVGGSLPPGPTAPSIVTQPTNRTVAAGQSALFAVSATGTAPLSYQWYFNTNTPLPGATSNSWTVANVQAADAGTYHVVVTNALGAVTSAVAVLSLSVPPPPGAPDGYATLNGGTTGGAAGPTVVVDNFAAFNHYVGTNVPYTIHVSGTIDLGSSNVRVRDNKTIIGLGTNATLIGDLKVFRNNNVIIRNLTFTNPNGVGDSDGLTLQECLNVWVDHCTFVDCDDGTLDISHGADWITVSWCHFYYTNPANDHRFSNLVGHSDSNAGEDAGKLHVTFHHNWWGQLVHERMPRVRFGRVHVFNNYYNSPGNNNCIRAAIASEILVENNYFDSVKNVWELYRTTGLDGKVFAANNIQVNTTWAAGSDSSSIQIPGTDVLSAESNGLNPPPYAYALDAANLVPGLVTNAAGAGKGPFAP
ncbi:MAG TPA: immunoglobulin domain-containing protein [Verrucomicrobiae bacterium]|nr:immunoglobulin domain-containing protein [Verrucomicrobiae bacterium]